MPVPEQAALFPNRPFHPQFGAQHRSGRAGQPSPSLALCFVRLLGRSPGPFPREIAASAVHQDSVPPLPAGHQQATGTAGPLVIAGELGVGGSLFFHMTPCLCARTLLPNTKAGQRIHLDTLSRVINALVPLLSLLTAFFVPVPAPEAAAPAFADAAQSPATGHRAGSAWDAFGM